MNSLQALKTIGNLHSITKGCAICYTDEYKVIEKELKAGQTARELLSMLLVVLDLDFEETIEIGKHQLKYKGDIPFEEFKEWLEK